MLFDTRFKIRRQDFYDREEELQLLTKGIDNGEGLIVIYGLRRLGKTSLVYVSLSELEVPFIPIDLRRYSEYPSLLTPSAIAQVVDAVLGQYEKLGRVKKVVENVLSYVESLDLGVIKLEPRKKRKLLTDTLEKADKWAKKHDTRLVLVLDEAQELRIIPRWRNILTWAIDNLENITFIVTGSEVGVLRNFLKLDDPKSPLFGRARLEIMLKKFPEDKAQDFLEKGFKEVGIIVTSNELNEAVSKLDGIVGWLTLYGHYRITYRLNHGEALSKIESDAEELLADELEKLIRYSPQRYLAILWAISLGLKSWSTIKHYAEGVIGYMYDYIFDKMLQNLMKYGFIEKTENLEYKITDPLLLKAVEKLQRKYWKAKKSINP